MRLGSGCGFDHLWEPTQHFVLKCEATDDVSLRRRGDGNLNWSGRKDFMLISVESSSTGTSSSDYKSKPKVEKAKNWLAKLG